MNKVVAFDLDGTLAQSELFLVKSYREALENKGLPVAPDEELRNMIGGTLEDNIKIAMPGHSMEDFLDYSREVHRLAASNVRKSGKLYPGIPETLAKLRAHGYAIALCSNGTEDYLSSVLGALGLPDYFDFIQHSVVGCNKSQLLSRIVAQYAPCKTVMVGDRYFDAEAAKNNDVPFIGCGYGLFPDEVQHADIVISHAEQLFDAVQTLIG